MRERCWRGLIVGVLAMPVAASCSGNDNVDGETDGAGTNGSGDDGGTTGGADDTDGAGDTDGSGTEGSGTSGGGSTTGGDAGGCGVDPYVHVWPDEVGTEFGAGSMAPMPTDSYDGPMDITTPTTIENVVVDGCLRIESDDVTVRNVVINCDGLYPVRAEGGSNAVVEHSTIHCNAMSKTFLVQDYGDLTVHRNELVGCEDFFFVGGEVDGLTVTCNYMHALNLTPDSHADGFQIGEASETTGKVLVRGNYIAPEADGGKTDTVFATNFSRVDIELRDNYFEVWGLRTIRCGGEATTCSVVNNTYEQRFEDMYLFSTGKLLYMMVDSPEPATFECNRLADGTLPPEVVDNVDRVAGADHVVTGCPDFPY